VSVAIAATLFSEKIRTRNPVGANVKNLSQRLVMSCELSEIRTSRVGKISIFLVS